MVEQCCSPNEKQLVDKIIDQGPRRAGDLDFKAVHGKLLLLEALYFKSPMNALNVCCLCALREFVCCVL